MFNLFTLNRRLKTPKFSMFGCNQCRVGDLRQTFQHVFKQEGNELGFKVEKRFLSGMWGYYEFEIVWGQDWYWNYVEGCQMKGRENEIGQN